MICADEEVLTQDGKSRRPLGHEGGCAVTPGDDCRVLARKDDRPQRRLRIVLMSEPCDDSPFLFLLALRLDLECEITGIRTLDAGNRGGAGFLSCGGRVKHGRKMGKTTAQNGGIHLYRSNLPRL